jgi:hypothetical protein
VASSAACTPHATCRHCDFNSEIAITQLPSIVVFKDCPLARTLIAKINNPESA